MVDTGCSQESAVAQDPPHQEQRYLGSRVRHNEQSGRPPWLPRSWHLYNVTAMFPVQRGFVSAPRTTSERATKWD